MAQAQHLELLTEGINLSEKRLVRSIGLLVVVLIMQLVISRTFQFIIFLRDTEDEEGYGDVVELERIYGLNNPNGTPSNVITLEDHFNNQFDCYMAGNFVPEPLTTTISGLYAWYYIPITLHVIPD
jgi:hypothetical protein